MRLINWLDEQIGLRVYTWLDMRYYGTGPDTQVGDYIPPCPAAVQRQEAAWRIALGSGVVRVGDLAVYYPDVTRETLRKDLVSLAEQGHLEAHGANKGRWYGPVRRDSMERRDVIGERGVEAVSGG